MNQKINVFSYLILSIGAVFILLTLIFFGSSNNPITSFNDKLLLGGLFITICILGISLSFYPGWYKRTLKFRAQNKNKQQAQKPIRKRKGHHPNCKQFRNHRIKIKNKTLCAGCLGLAIGSIISILFMLIYLIFANFSFNFIFFIFLGLVIIFLVYIEIFYPIKNAIIHTVSNTIFVLGLFLITLSIFEITSSIIYSVITIILLFLFLDTRIQISRYRHSLICNNCKEKCKMY